MCLSLWDEHCAVSFACVTKVQRNACATKFKNYCKPINVRDPLNLAKLMFLTQTRNSMDANFPL